MPHSGTDHQHHISQQFNKDLTMLREHLMLMGGLVEQQVSQAITAMTARDTELAEQVRDQDKQVNALEKTIDREWVNVIAMRQPAASDLRLVVASAKIVNDLERVGDEAKKIAKISIALAGLDVSDSARGFVEVRNIGRQVLGMLHNALDAFARFDTEAAFQVIKEDEVVDSEYKSAMRSLVTVMMEDPRTITHILNIMWVLRALERIGDHACNVSQHVIYLIKGQDVRHISISDTESLIVK
ncbi:MAG: phosphate transport system regulatory protein PhoU [unclassified Hahellaceae]|nr:phosphate transport system regulatory protein PhoU [Hahellaceae bacterium]|tara:strand:- start:13668 stop:14393 length:726 start_codon:yes stop_codon:yes gene_type:complete